MKGQEEEGWGTVKVQEQEGKYVRREEQYRTGDSYIIVFQVFVLLGSEQSFICLDTLYYRF